MSGRGDLEIDVVALRDALASDAPPLLVDVRRHDEVAICALPGALHVPLDEIDEHVAELDPTRDVVVYCHHGVRSLHAVCFLREAGLARTRSLRGGIDEWSLRIDPSVSRY